MNKFFVLLALFFTSVSQAGSLVYHDYLVHLNNDTISKLMSVSEIGTLYFSGTPPTISALPIGTLIVVKRNAYRVTGIYKEQEYTAVTTSQPSKKEVYAEYDQKLDDAINSKINAEKEYHKKQNLKTLEMGPFTTALISSFSDSQIVFKSEPDGPFSVVGKFLNDVKNFRSFTEIPPGTILYSWNNSSGPFYRIENMFVSGNKLIVNVRKLTLDDVYEKY